MGQRANRVFRLTSNLATSGFEIPADALADIEKILDFKKFERHVGWCRSFFY